MGFTYREAYILPIWQRIWFIQRLSEEIKKSSDSGSSQSRAAHTNSPDMRAMNGNHHAHAPARLRRFT